VPIEGVKIIRLVSFTVIHDTPSLVLQISMGKKMALGIFVVITSLLGALHFIQKGQ